MIKHLYPDGSSGNGVGVFGEMLEAATKQMKSDKDIYHFEIGYNEHDLFWQVRKLLKKRTNQKVVITIHDTPMVVGKLFSTYIPWHNVFAKAIRKFLDITIGSFIIGATLRKADALIVLNKLSVEILARKYKLDLSKIHVAPQPSLVPLSRNKKVVNKVPKLLYFGNIGERKGLDLLLDALQKFDNQDLELDVIGGFKDNEAYYSNLQKQAERLPEGIKVNFLGYQSDAFLSDSISGCDIVVLPYRQEVVVHTSGPLMASMAAGKPVLCSNLVIFNQVIDGKTGVFFKKGDSGSLAEKLHMLVASPDLRNKIGQAAQDWNQDNASLDILIASVNKVYQGI